MSWKLFQILSFLSITPFIGKNDITSEFTHSRFYSVSLSNKGIISATINNPERTENDSN